MEFPKDQFWATTVFALYQRFTQGNYFSKIHHFADDTNFLHESPSLKDFNRKINYDMSRVTHWLRANRIFLNIAKTNNSISFMQNKNYQKAKFLNKWSKNQNKNTNKILRSNMR